jgi:hypothetical protein
MPDDATKIDTESRPTTVDLRAEFETSGVKATGPAVPWASPRSPRRFT